MKLVIAILFVLVVKCSQSSVESWLEAAKEGTKDKGEIWAVLVAGSMGWQNYRHQADLCHTYQLLTKIHGIPRERIIVMMYNDIAHNRRNREPGTIRNAIDSKGRLGPDVYKGVEIDYPGREMGRELGLVTADRFMSILNGDVMEGGSRKTLKSGPDDYVFVNFVDHGGPGVLGFPWDELHLYDLQRTLHSMYRNKQYKQMLWYVEACYSGSMFESLFSDMNITAVTAANTQESSYACGWDDYNRVYVGDCWSMNWMKNTEEIYPRLDQESVQEQYEIVKKMTTQSHPSIYGDLTFINNEPISTFLGLPEKKEPAEVEPSRTLTNPTDATSVPDVLLETLRRSRGNTAGLDEDLEKEIRYHEEKERQVQVLLRGIVAAVSGGEDMVTVFQEQRQSILHPLCNKEVLDTFYNKCFKMQTHPYVNKYTFWISNLCNTYNSETIVKTIIEACRNKE